MYYSHACEWNLSDWIKIVCNLTAGISAVNLIYQILSHFGFFPAMFFLVDTFSDCKNISRLLHDNNSMDHFPLIFASLLAGS